MTVLDKIYWRSTGAGPAVVVPRLNVDWTQVDLAALEARFTVVVVSPRGFGPSERPGGYSGAGFVADVARVLDHLGVLEYAAFGYSMNGVMAARLAVGNPRVRAVACGGFPLTADLGAMGERARLRHTAAQADAAAWAEVTAMYDPAAAGVLGRRRLPAARCPGRPGLPDQVLVGCRGPRTRIPDRLSRAGR